MNRSYVMARDALIPTALKHANETAGKSHGERDYQEWADEWNFHYHTKMNDLAAEVGIANPQIRRWESQGVGGSLPSERPICP